MSFYVTLPSHGADLLSEYGKKSNKQNDFTINLKKTIKLPLNSYEVALVEMSFRNFWKVNLGRFKIIRNQNEIIFDEDILIYDGMPIGEICRFLNNKFEIHKSGIEADLTMKEYFEEIEKKRSQNDIKKLLTNYDLNRVNFIYLGNNSVSIYVPEDFSLDITGLFARLIYKRNDNFDGYGEFVGRKYVGIDWKNFSHYHTKNPSSVLAKRETAKGDFKMLQHDPNNVKFAGDSWKTTRLYFNFEKLKYIQELFVYTDIIEESHVGQIMSRLLRVVKVDSDFDNISSITYNNGHYIGLENDQFDQIRMIVKDSFGNEIQFLDEFTPVTYKLHFRPKEYYK